MGSAVDIAWGSEVDIAWGEFEGNESLMILL